jgi:hypothetical protein
MERRPPRAEVRLVGADQLADRLERRHLSPPGRADPTSFFTIS